jgi:uncharacterized protein (DUF362 family)/NAD-dependent dihydropyrimidine dehydrogenase PreA subunit
MHDPIANTAQGPGPTPTVSLVRLESYEPKGVDRALREVLEPLGGLAAFVPAAARVCLKPNFLLPSAPERAICTHPEIIRAVARLARECGASEVVATDSPGMGTARRAARRLALADGDLLAVQDADDGIDVSPPDAPFHRVRLIRRLLESDVVLNLPKAKTHGQMVMTGAVKNSFGAVVGMEKPQWHFRAGRSPEDFARLLLHVHALVKPRLSILDGVLGMEGNGPSGGDPRPLGLLMASTDAHALDAVLADIWGLEIRHVPTLAVARDLGLLPSREVIQVVGSSPEEFRPRPAWRLPRLVPLRGFGGPAWLSALFERMLRLRPEVDRDACRACGDCVAVCAAKAITLAPDGASTRSVAVIDPTPCISCFCCQEMCPEGAISVEAGPLARLFGVGVR